MKTMVLAFLAAFFLHTAEAQTLQQAEATAKAEHKAILLRFSGSDWCIPCIRLQKEVFSQDAFRTYAQAHLVFVEADFPRLKKHQLPKVQKVQNESLAALYNPKGVFPLTVLLDADGKVLKAWEGAAAHDPAGFIVQVQPLLNDSH